MADIIKRNRKEWFIYHYNIWLRTLTGAEANLKAIELQKLEMKDISAYSKAVAVINIKIDEAKRYIKVLDKLIEKEEEKND